MAESGLLIDITEHLDSGNDGLLIKIGGQIVRVNPRIGGRIV